MKRCVKRFQTDAVYVRRGRRSVPVTGVFDNDFLMVSMDSGAEVASKDVTFGMHADSLPFEPRRGDKLIINQVRYLVDQAQPDSEFGLVLVLKKATE